MIPLPRVTVVVAAALLCTAPYSAAQTVSPTLGQSIAWQVYYSGSQPTITGIILAPSGRPAAKVEVSVPAAGLATVTDSAGRFSVALPASGDWNLRIGFGSEARTVDLTVPSASRVVLAAILPDGPGLCTNLCRGTRCDDLQLLVVDSITDRSPRATATLRLVHPSGTTMNRVDLGANDGLTRVYIGMARTITTTGYHTIELSVPGYQPWRKERVWLEQITECDGVLLGREHVARLVPSPP